MKFLPIIFVSCTILGLYSIYVVFHCLPLLQLGQQREYVDAEARLRGEVELAVFHVFTIFIVISYIRSILTHPGEIPDSDPHWEYHHQRLGDFVPNFLQETKKTGDRRHCKWCGKYKPDRCHHCRVCRTCILKMDHHCPWIYNCVGFYNYKFFFLLLFYSMLDCHLIVWTMAESVMRSINVETPFLTMFTVLFGETLAVFLGTLVTLFFGFHVWLMHKAMTTIEFCEKSLPKSDTAAARSYDTSVYHLGFCGNIRAVLGDNFFLWLLPLATPSGDGLNFISDQTRLTKDFEVNKGVRRKQHRRVRGWEYVA